MSDNLNLLHQNYCRPGTASGKFINDLFPLERECNEGKLLSATAPNKLLHLEQFDPCGLEQSYVDQATGAELPVFAVFNLAGDHRCDFQITAESGPAIADPTSLMAHLPFKKAQAFVRKINERRTKSERWILISLILGMLLGPFFILLYALSIAASAAPLVVTGGSILGGLLGYVLGISILDRLCPWQRLVITAEFNGILPKETREKARAAQDHFDNLYLVVDQQHRWKSALLPDPIPRGLDPLLIGELRRGQQAEFFVVDQFELTAAERYLTDEFATVPD
jgi:hypothetical protein